MSMKHSNRALTADDVVKASKIMVEVQTSEFNTGFSFSSYFDIEKDKLIRDLTEFKNMSRWSNWCFSLESKDTVTSHNDFLEIPDNYRGKIKIIIGQMNR